MSNPQNTNSLETPNVIPAVCAVEIPECVNYRPGHSIHQIQWRHASGVVWEPARIERVDGGTIWFIVNGIRKTGWNHEPDLLQAMTDIAALVESAQATWCERYNLLKVTHEVGAHAVYLADEPAPGCAMRLR